MPHIVTGSKLVSYESFNRRRQVRLRVEHDLIERDMEDGLIDRKMAINMLVAVSEEIDHTLSEEDRIKSSQKEASK